MLYRFLNVFEIELFDGDMFILKIRNLFGGFFDFVIMILDVIMVGMLKIFFREIWDNIDLLVGDNLRMRFLFVDMVYSIELFMVLEFLLMVFCGLCIFWKGIYWLWFLVFRVFKCFIFDLYIESWEIDCGVLNNVVGIVLFK